MDLAVLADMIDVGNVVHFWCWNEMELRVQGTVKPDGVASRQSGAAAQPIVGNLLNSLPCFALRMGRATDDTQARLIAAIEKPLPHQIVRLLAANGPS